MLGVWGGIVERYLLLVKKGAPRQVLLEGLAAHADSAPLLEPGTQGKGGGRDGLWDGVGRCILYVLTMRVYTCFVFFCLNVDVHVYIYIYTLYIYIYIY